MMQIAEDKHCWLADLDNIPSEELALWIAYYELEQEKRKRDEKTSGVKSRFN